MSYINIVGMNRQGPFGPTFPDELPSANVVAAYLMQPESFERSPQPSVADADMSDSSLAAWSAYECKFNSSGTELYQKIIDGSDYVLNVQSTDNDPDSPATNTPCNQKAHGYWAAQSVLIEGAMYYQSVEVKSLIAGISSRIRQARLASGSIDVSNFVDSSNWAGDNAIRIVNSWATLRTTTSAWGDLILFGAYEDYRVD